MQTQLVQISLNIYIRALSICLCFFFLYSSHLFCELAAEYMIRLHKYAAQCSREPYIVGQTTPLALSCLPLPILSCILPYFNSRHKTIHFGENFMKIGPKLKKLSVFKSQFYVYSSWGIYCEMGYILLQFLILNTSHDIGSPHSCMTCKKCPPWHPTALKFELEHCSLIWPFLASICKGCFYMQKILNKWTHNVTYISVVSTDNEGLPCYRSDNCRHDSIKLAGVPSWFI